MSEEVKNSGIYVYSDHVNITYQQEKEKVSEKTKEIPKVEKKENVLEVGKSRIIAVLLALFLGRFGIHKFYLGKPAVGLIYLIFSRFEIMVFISCVDSIIYVLMDEETWNKNYKPKKIKLDKKAKSK